MASEYELKILREHCKGKGLNIGCGSRPVPGAINVDIDPKAKADLYASASMLPLYSNTMDYIISSHCLEHVQEAPLIVLREWLRVLRVGGVLVFIVPDGEDDYHALTEYPGKFVEGKHVHHFIDKNLYCLMQCAGFTKVTVNRIDRPEWKTGTLVVYGTKERKSTEEIPGNSFQAYLLWLGAVRKTITIHGLIKYLKKKW